MVESPGRLRYVAGDHHVHTLYSPDGLYRVIDHASRAATYGLEWLVVTDHGGPAHAKIGVELVHPDIVAARREVADLLVFQGVEWNVPAAQHGTVFVAPGPDEMAVLRTFERAYDGEVTGTMDGTTGGPSTARHEALALAGLRHLARRRRSGAVDDALMLVNHPALRGVNAPHQLRDWRDAEPEVVIGMEGAPGHQAAGLPDPARAARARGNYVFDPPPDAFPGYPPESYRTYGGFDWMTATVGGLWDAMLAEGRPWWITANSDSHGIHDDTQVRGRAEAGGSFWKQGRHPDPVPGGTVSVANGDFWPGYYSRTHVGVPRLGYREVMAGMRAGRIWVDHGGLLDALDVRVRSDDLEDGDPPEVTLGDTLRVRRGAEVSLVVTVRPARTNHHGDAPRLARVDVVRGAVTGPATDRDAFTAPTARVVDSFEPGRADEDGEVRFVHRLGPVTEPCYLRVRGTDGNRTEPGLYGADVDPFGPAVDLRGNADPWIDLWFYTNPIFLAVAP